MAHNIIVVVLLLLASLIATAMAQGWCDRSLCPNGGRHIMCGNNGRWAPGCRGERVNIDRYIRLILHEHNQRRNLVAGGGLARFPQARQMATMQWDTQLANLASYNILQCRMQHEQCRGTRSYRYAGQNLSVFYARLSNIEAFLRQRIGLWFDEHRFANAQDIANYRSRGGPAIGHFTAMVHERNSRVGCAVARYTDRNNSPGTLLACNYAVTNMQNNPIYRSGRAASGCRTGRNNIYRNLCSVNEPYNFNEWRG